MAADRAVESALQIQETPRLSGGRMVLAFSGWMDGGNVSTGTVEWLVRTLEAREVARIDPEPFYIYNFPGTMEMSALFRPYTKIDEGIVAEFTPPENTFWASEEHGLLLFRGKEPNFAWRRFADCLFELATRAGVTSLFFVGSVGGLVPHTREPRLRSTVSDARLKAELERLGAKLTDYEGPASFSTLLLAEAPQRGLEMTTLVAEIPAYIQSTNPKSIEAVTRKLAALLGVQVPLKDLRQLTAEWEERLNKLLRKKIDLSKHIHKLEADYDNEVFEQMDDLKQWLEQQGLQVD
ncbi:MAG: PAC2 family protein [Planctomycetota bacterium]